MAGRIPNNHNPAVYSAVPVNRLQALFDETCALISAKCTLPINALSQQQLPGLVGSADAHVGSMHVPRVEVVRDAVAHLRRKIVALSKAPVLSTVQLHNVYTAYVCVFLMSITGVRAASGLVAAYFDVDFRTGMCFVSDKDSAKYINSRVVWLPPNFLEQIGFYIDHLIRLRQWLITENWHSIARLDAIASIPSLSSIRSPNRESDLQHLAEAAPLLFFLSKKGLIREVSPSLIAEHMGKDWSLRVGSLRHFVRSSLLRAGLNGEMINALIGHADRGQSPWGKFSTLPTAIWREQLGGALQTTFEQLGLKPLSSPLIGAVQ